MLALSFSVCSWAFMAAFVAAVNKNFSIMALSLTITAFSAFWCWRELQALRAYDKRRMQIAALYPELGEKGHARMHGFHDSIVKGMRKPRNQLPPRQIGTPRQQHKGR